MVKPTPQLEMTEAQLTTAVRDLARLFGWMRYHAWLSKHSASGFPDEALTRRGRLVFAELKSRRGKLTPDQEAWLTELGKVEGIEVYVWRPDDLEQIAEILR